MALYMEAWRVMMNIKGFCLAQKVDVPLLALGETGSRRRQVEEFGFWGNAKSVGK